jgi:alkanesulfonate monooxygenase SsuD/methylene tetrahydromethanopterin reductase-like flavin-dependent oxidoreductase (luciferase family)
LGAMRSVEGQEPNWPLYAVGANLSTAVVPTGRRTADRWCAVSNQVKFALAWMPQSAAVSVDIARGAERLGFSAFGIGDGPFLHQETYTTTTACLLATERIPGGPFVSNTVIRHWCTHASSARTLADLCPGRFVMGLATGDGAVRSVGLEPMRWADFADSVQELREHAPDDLSIHCTVSGPKGAEVAATFADVLVILTGDAPVAINELAARARAARQRAGVTGPFEIWAFQSIFVLPEGADVQAARASKRASTYSVAHFVFAQTYEAKDVPEEWQADIDERLARYDYGHHAVFSADNPNHLLFADRPEIEEYLVNRMFFIGTEEQVQERFAKLFAATDLDGVWLHAQSVEDVETVASAVSPWLRPSEAMTV